MATRKNLLDPERRRTSRFPSTHGVRARAVSRAEVPGSPRLARLTRFVLGHRRLVIALWLVLALAGMSGAGAATKALSDQYTVPGHEGYETNARITRVFGNGGNGAPLVAVVTLPAGTSADTPTARAGLRQVAARLRAAVPRARISSLLSTGDRAFVSPDGRTAFVLAYPPPEKGGFGQSTKAVTRARAALARLTISGARVHVTGLDALTAESGQRGGLSVAAEATVGGLGALVVLALVFASLLALVPLLLAGVSIMTSFLLVWALTSVTEVSVLVEFLISLVGLGVAIDYSLLVISRWREEQTAGYRGEEAVVRAMATAGHAVLVSGTTVAIGLLALVALPLPFLRSVGYGGMVIPLVSVAATLTLLPVVLLKAGHRLEWPRRRRGARTSDAWDRWTAWVVRHRMTVASASVLLLGGLTVAATTLHLGPAAGEPNTISQRGDARVGLMALENSGVGIGAMTPIEILTPAGKAAAVSDQVKQLSGIRGAALSAKADGLAVVDAFASSNSSAAVDGVRAAAHRVTGSAKVGGVTAQNDDFISATYDSFPLMLAVIAVLTFLLLARALRSVFLPLKAVVLNLLSLAAAWGVLALIWQHGWGADALWGVPTSSSIPSWLPLIVFALLFGLSMDYEVFILTRVREAHDEGRATDAAVVRGMGRTGRLVTSAALILLLGFLAMSTAPSTGVKMMATGLGAGIILDATVIRSLLVPAAVSLLGRWNWWMPQSLAALLRVRANPAPRPQP